PGADDDPSGVVDTGEDRGELEPAVGMVRGQHGPVVRTEEIACAVEVHTHSYPSRPVGQRHTINAELSQPARMMAAADPGVWRPSRAGPYRQDAAPDRPPGPRPRGVRGVEGRQSARRGPAPGQVGGAGQG